MATALSLTQDGHIDVAALDQWPQDTVRDWVFARLNGQDTLWPVDCDNFETPDALFVKLWRQADPRSAFVERLGRACAVLLHLAWESEPAPWMPPLFDLVATIRPVACQQFLNAIAAHHHFSDTQRAHKLDRSWLRTLAAYDRQSPNVIGVWLDLLEDDRYVDIAYRALGRSLDLAVYFLPEYYARLSEVERSVLLPEAVRGMVERGWDTVREKLERYRNKYEHTQGLCDAIEAALAELRLSPMRPPAPGPQRGPAHAAERAGGNGVAVLDGVANEPPLAKVA